MSDTVKEYKLLPRQLEFCQAKEKEVLFSGAWGAAKSHALCLAVLKEAAMYPRSQILLCRKTYTSLRRSTMQTLLAGDNAIIPKGSYVYNKMAQTVTLNGNGSVIFMMGIEDIEKVRSMNLGLVCVDEASELTLNEWTELMGRLRNDNGSRQIKAATNPSSPSHWLYERFFINKNKSRKVIKSTSLDNPFLPKDYLENLKEMPQNLYNRFVLGEWLAMENVIYSQFNRDIHIKHREFGEFTEFFLGVDFGFTAPTAISLIGITTNGELHLIEEQKEKKLLIGRIVELCEKYRHLNPKVYVDPSAPALIAEFEHGNWNVTKADNSVDSGISRMQNLLSKNQISLEPTCTEFIGEIENYTWGENKKPVKVNDHLLDSVRYVINDVISESFDYSKPMIMHEESTEFDDDDDF